MNKEDSKRELSKRIAQKGLTRAQVALKHHISEKHLNNCFSNPGRNIKTSIYQDFGMEINTFFFGPIYSDHLKKTSRKRINIKMEAYLNELIDKETS